MSSTSRTFALALLSMGLAACGSGGDSPVAEQSLNVDYSTLRLAESRGSPLLYASGDEQIPQPLRNGVRMTMTQRIGLPAITTTGSAGHGSDSGTTVQVDGVDEAAVVLYDGHFMDEHGGDLRILASGQLVHRLTVQRDAGRGLTAGDSSTSQYPPLVLPRGGVLHDDAAFAVQGDQILSKRWEDLPASP